MYAMRSAGAGLQGFGGGKALPAQLPSAPSLLAIPRGVILRTPYSASCRGTARVTWTAALKDSGTTSVPSLSDLLVFESELGAGSSPDQPKSQEDPTLRAQEILARASRALAAARDIASESATEASPEGSAARGGSTEQGGAVDKTRSVLRAALESTLPAPSSSAGASAGGSTGSRPAASPATPSPKPPARSSGDAGSGSAPGGAPGSDGASASGRSAMPSWTESLFSDRGGGSSGGPMMQRQQRQAEGAELMFAEPDRFPSSFLDLVSQEDQDARAARQIKLPPLQSVLDLTSASRPPSRHMEMESEQETSVSAPTRAGQMLQDGSGVLGDGTRWEKRSGEEIGPDGYWKRWTQLSGSSADGSVSWEECWWESSDYKGLRELGAAKKGTALDGSAWNEAWSEKMYHEEGTNERKVERTAHKWARDPQNDEWEEQWGENYSEKGAASKWADKWARQADNVWHERWGEEYDGSGGCVKYTDKWAERLHEGAAPEQWGDKWKESFKDGQGSKHGEVWSAGTDGSRYNRWWNEEHFGNGYVRKYGNSTGGENWDSTEQMDTYYNPIPHFGYDLAVKHSPDLVNIPLLRPKHVKASAPAAAAAGSGGGGR